MWKCKKCSEMNPDTSSYCQSCGESVNSIAKDSEIDSGKRGKKKTIIEKIKDTFTLHDLIIIQKIIFIIGATILSINIGSIAPGIGKQHELFSRILTVSIAGVSIFVYKKFKRKPERRVGFFMVAAVILLNLTVSGLFRLYIDKYYDAISVPTTENIYIKEISSVDEIYTTNWNNRYVSNFKVDITLEGALTDGSPYLVEVGKDYVVNVDCTYMIRGERYSQHRTTTINISLDTFPKFSTDLEIQMSDSEYVVVKIVYERVLGVWEVLL